MITLVRPCDDSFESNINNNYPTQSVSVKHYFILYTNFLGKFKLYGDFSIEGFLNFPFFCDINILI